MTKRINIILPEKTINVIDRVTPKGTRSRFIERAVLHYIETRGKQTLRDVLERRARSYDGGGMVPT
jgi:CopG family transcriptional regulator/antitoxin EndoAI